MELNCSPLFRDDILRFYLEEKCKDSHIFIDELPRKVRLLEILEAAVKKGKQTSDIQ
jgi:adenylate kinase family enzyme